MPTLVNNVDVSVNANILFGINSLLFTLNQTETDSFFDDDLK